MAWGDRASARFSAELVGKESRGRLVWNLLDMVTGGTNPDVTPRYELLFKDNQSGEIIFRETYDGGIAGEEALRLANERLEQMTVAAFSDMYGIPSPD